MRRYVVAQFLWNSRRRNHWTSSFLSCCRPQTNLDVDVERGFTSSCSLHSCAAMCKTKLGEATGKRKRIEGGGSQIDWILLLRQSQTGRSASSKGTVRKSDKQITGGRRGLEEGAGGGRFADNTWPWHAHKKWIITRLGLLYKNIS